MRLYRNTIIILTLLHSVPFCFSQNFKLGAVDSTKHYFSLAFTPHWNRCNILNVSGGVDEVRGWATQGLVSDVAYLYFSKKIIYLFSIGHGFYREGFYYNYENLSHPHFPSDIFSFGFEKYSPLQYTSMKFIISNNFRNQKRRIKYSCGIDIRMNWGVKIFDSGDRNNFSFTSRQDIIGDSINEGPIIRHQIDSKIVNNISVNPLLGADYIFRLKNKSFLNIGIIFSVPFISVLKSNVQFYPDYEDLKSSFNMNYNGGFLGIKTEYIIPF